MDLKDHALTNQVVANTVSYDVRIVKSHWSTAKIPLTTERTSCFATSLTKFSKTTDSLKQLW